VFPFEAVELRLFRRHKQLKHKSALTLAVKVIGQLLQTARLSLVQRRIALRIVANQHLAERRMKKLDVFGEVCAELEVKFILSAFLGWAAVTKPSAAASRRIAAPNCSSTRMPAFSSAMRDRQKLRGLEAGRRRRFWPRSLRSHR